MGKLLGTYLKQSRKDKKITIRKLAELTSISTSYIVYIEKGEKEPSMKNLQLLANTLDISFEKLSILQGEDKKNKVLMNNLSLSMDNSNAISEHEGYDTEEPGNIKENEASNSGLLSKLSYSNELSMNLGLISVDPSERKRMLSVKKYNNTISNFLSGISWEIIKDTFFISKVNNTINAEANNKKWIITSYFYDENDHYSSDTITKVFGNLMLQVNNLNNRYSIATNNPDFFQDLIKGTTPIFKEMINLSFILVDESGEVTLKEMKTY